MRRLRVPFGDGMWERLVRMLRAGTETDWNQPGQTKL